MFKNAIIACLLMFSMNIFAACEINTINTPNLSADVTRQMKELCEQDIAKNKSSSIKENIELVTTMGGIAKEFATSLGIAARELGYAVNEFISSPAGILTVAVIIWKAFMIQFLGIFLMVISLVASYKLIQHVLTDSMTHVTVKRLWGAYETVKTKRNYSQISTLDENHFCIIGGLLIFCVALNWIIVYHMVS